MSVFMFVCFLHLFGALSPFSLHKLNSLLPQSSLSVHWTAVLSHVVLMDSTWSRESWELLCWATIQQKRLELCYLVSYFMLLVWLLFGFNNELSSSFLQYKLLLYLSQQKQVTSAKIHVGFAFTVSIVMKDTKVDAPSENVSYIFPIIIAIPV